jgi:hypothetical protein
VGETVAGAVAVGVALPVSTGVLGVEAGVPLVGVSLAPSLFLLSPSSDAQPPRATAPSVPRDDVKRLRRSIRLSFFMALTDWGEG